jgi:hypothetical protein
MINCILINNDINNDVLEIKVKNLTEESIFKKCNFKSDKYFSKIKEWKIENNNIELWGKNIGNKNLKNNWDFFNKENVNIYGKSIFVIKNNENEYISLSKDYLYNKVINNINELSCEKDIINENNISSNKALIYKEDLNDDKDDDHDNESIISDYSFNSELSYEIYCYSDDDN